MRKKNQIVSVIGAFLTISLALLLAGCQAPVESDTNAEKALEALGAKIVRDDNAPGKPITQVQLANATDANLKEVAGLKNLRSLDLAGTKVTDAGLKELAGLKSLSSLNLVGTPVTDAGLKELAALKNLHILNVNETQVTDAGEAELRKALPYCQIQR